MTAAAAAAYRSPMRDWLQVVVLLVLAIGLPPVVVAVCTGDVERWRAYRAAARLLQRFARRRPGAEVRVLRRPIEDVVADLRRLHGAFHRGGMRFAKWEGCRQAYDHVLGEVAEMVEVPHLLAVLPPGTELDRERERIEDLLEDAGLLPRRWAA